MDLLPQLLQATPAPAALPDVFVAAPLASPTMPFLVAVLAFAIALLVGAVRFMRQTLITVSHLLEAAANALGSVVALLMIGIILLTAVIVVIAG